MSVSLRVTAGTVGGDGSGPGDLVAFVVALLAECREQDDPLVRSEPVGDPSSGCSEREPEFEEPVTERPRVRHPGLEAIDGEPFNHHDRPVAFLVGEGVDPFFDLEMEFDFEHYTIIADMRSSYKRHVPRGVSSLRLGRSRTDTVRLHHSDEAFLAV